MGMAKNYKMLGVYLQRSWIVLFICGLLSLPLYIFASPILKLLGQLADIAELTGMVSMGLIPLHFSLCFQFPLQRFLQSQLKTYVIAWVSMMALLVHSAMSWLIVYRYQLGLVGMVVALNLVVADRNWVVCLHRLWWLLGDLEWVFHGSFSWIIQWYSSCGIHLYFSNSLIFRISGGRSSFL